MSFVSFINKLKIRNHLQNYYPNAEVIDNNDPLKLCRVKIKIPNLIDGDENYLPWAMRMVDPFLGEGSELFSVPDIGSKIMVYFPFNNINFPVYGKDIYNSNNHTGEFDSSYPNSYGFKDKIGTIFKINLLSGLIKLTQKSGNILSISDSRVYIKAPTTKIDGNLEVTTGASGTVICGSILLTFEKGILVNIQVL